MATLRYSQIRAHPGGTIKYIANKDKMISEKTHDVYNVLQYMGEPESTERVYSWARHCSQNPDLAEKQMELYRQRYFANKKGGVQGLKAGKEELLGLHFFLSYTVADNPTEYLMDKIAMKIAAHPLLQDFAVFGANHFDREHKHTHFFVSAYSADGKPRKLCFRKEDYNEIRRFANKLCVEHGLSIIDLETLRYNNPEYSDWVDGVIAEGKVIVHKEKEDRKKWHAQKATTRQIYYKQMKEREEFMAEEDAKLGPGEKFERDFFYTFDGERMLPKSGADYHYGVRLHSPDGTRRTPLELTVRMIFMVWQGESRYIQAQSPATWLRVHSKVDHELQEMYNCYRTACEMNITSMDGVETRLADVGRQMNALKQEKRRHEQSIAKQEQIIDAYGTYIRVRKQVEGVQEPDSAARNEYNDAYAILAQNQILTADAFAGLRRRCEFERQKVVDYDKRMPELNKQYRDLKKLQASIGNPQYIIREIYDYSEQAELHKAGAVDAIITESKARSDARRCFGEETGKQKRA